MRQKACTMKLEDSGKGCYCFFLSGSLYAVLPSISVFKTVLLYSLRPASNSLYCLSWPWAHDPPASVYATMTHLHCEFLGGESLFVSVMPTVSDTCAWPKLAT